MIGKLACGGNVYTVYVRLVDRAGNVSQLKQASITTNSTCASCFTVGNSILINPIQTAGKGQLNDIFSEGSDGHRVHAGVDINAGLNNPVLAAKNGTVERKGYHPDGWGYHIILKHNNVPDPYEKDSNGNPLLTTIYTIYAHLAIPSGLEIGQNITQGQVIGVAGSTGSSTGPHLHLQIQKVGAYANPIFANKTAAGLGSVVDPIPYLPPFNGTVPQELLAKYCPGNGTGNGDDSYGNGQDDDSDLVANYPKLDENQAIAKNIASEAIINYLVNEFEPTQTDLEIWKDKTQKFYNLAYVLTDSYSAQGLPLDIIKSGVFSLCEGRVFVLLLDKNKKNNNVNTINKNQTSTDGMIVVNNFRRKADNSPRAYLVKGDTYKKYAANFDDPDYSNINACEAIGLPNNEEQVALKQSSPSQRDTGWKQTFDKGVFVNNQNQVQAFAKYQNNSIYTYNFDCSNSYNTNGCGGNMKAFYTVSKVADKFETEGGINSQYVLPSNNTTGEAKTAYCKQNFLGKNELGGISREINLCNNIEQSFTVNLARLINPTYTGGLKLINKPEAKYKYSNQDVWIYSHGMSNTYEDMNPVKEALLSKQSDSIILALDWREGADDAKAGIANPNLTDEWIRPTAKRVVDVLTSWGLTDPNKIHLVGHSMGTLMSAEIARQYNIRNNNQPVKDLILLDPPNYFPGYTAFDVDDSENTQDSIYNGANGYSNKAKAINMQAFTGLTPDGKDNMCGNSPLNKTASQNILITSTENSIFDIKTTTPCPIHGVVVKAWANLIDSQQLANPRLNIGNQGIFDYTQQNYLQPNSVNQSQALIYTTSLNGDIQNMTTTQNSTITQQGRDNQPNIFTNTDNGTTLASDKKTINIQGFNDSGDRISLQTSKVSILAKLTSTYSIQNNQIYRKVISCSNLDPSICVTQTDNYNDVVVEGGRVGSLSLNDELIKAQSSDAAIRNESAINLR